MRLADLFLSTQVLIHEGQSDISMPQPAGSSNEIGFSKSLNDRHIESNSKSSLCRQSFAFSNVYPFPYHLGIHCFGQFHDLALPRTCLLVLKDAIVTKNFIIQSV